MAFVTIISGTFGFYDPQMRFASEWIKPKLYRYNVGGVQFRKKRFEQVVIMEDGNVITLPSVIAPVGTNEWIVTQTMGSGKTILGIEHLARIHRGGGRTAANISVKWFGDNIGKPKQEWTPNILSLEDLERARGVTVLLDDIKKTVASWQTKEAKLISAIVNTSRKESVNLIITSQRVVNFVPKDIREVVTNYEIPYITIRDMRRKTPDGMGFPVEMEVLNISANGVFLGFGVHNGFVPDGKTLMPTPRLLDAYSTLEIAVDLKKGKSKGGVFANPAEKEPYSGYYNERALYEELMQYEGVVQHIAAENPQQHETDIIFANSRVYHIDVVSLIRRPKKPGQKREYLHLQTAKKDLNEVYYRCREKGVIPLLAFYYGKGWKLIKVERLLPWAMGGNILLSKETKPLMKPLTAFFKRKEVFRGV